MIFNHAIINAVAALRLLLDNFKILELIGMQGIFPWLILIRWMNISYLVEYNVKFSDQKGALIVASSLRSKLNTFQSK